MAIPDEIGRILLPVYHNTLYKAQKYRWDYYQKEYYKYEQKLEDIRNIHEDKKCFIWGGGPSLKKTNISLLKDEINFGTNSLATAEFADMFDFFCVYDGGVWNKYQDSIKKLTSTVFLGDYAGKRYLANRELSSNKFIQEPIIIKKRAQTFDNAKDLDIIKGAYSGASVVGFAIQLAHHMGFKKIYLIGCDTDYTNGYWHTKNAHADAFFGSFVHDVARLMEQYKLLKNIIDCQIINCTVGGKLEVFKRKKLEDVV